MLHGAADGRGSSSSFDYLTPNEFVARATKTSTASPALIRVPTVTRHTQAGWKSIRHRKHFCSIGASKPDERLASWLHVRGPVCFIRRVGAWMGEGGRHPS